MITYGFIEKQILQFRREYESLSKKARVISLIFDFFYFFILTTLFFLVFFFMKVRNTVCKIWIKFKKILSIPFRYKIKLVSK